MCSICPIGVCVAGEVGLLNAQNQLQFAAEPSSADWSQQFNRWGEVDRNSLIVHSSGMSFMGKPNWAWSTPTQQPTRFDVVYPRPVAAIKPTTTEPVVIEIDRQWLLSQRQKAPIALAELRDKFRQLNDALSGQREIDGTVWSELRLKDPDGPPRFHWQLASGATAPQLVLNKGELSLAISDQRAGVRSVIPRSVATIDGLVEITSSVPTVFKFCWRHRDNCQLLYLNRSTFRPCGRGAWPSRMDAWFGMWADH